MTRLILFLCLVFWQCPAVSSTAPLLLERAYLTDASGTLTLGQLDQGAFKPYQGSLGLGFHPGAVWVRLSLAPAALQEGRPVSAVLQVSPLYLEHIELFTGGTGRWITQTRGPWRGPKGSGIADGTHGFDVVLPTTEPVHVFLRLTHQGYLIAFIDVVPKDEAVQAVAERVRGITASFVMAMCLLGLGLAFFIADRSLLMGVYCLFQFAVVLFIASNAGLLALALPGVSPEALSSFNHLLYALRVGMTVLLAWALLKAHRPARVFQRGMLLMLAMCALNALLVITGQVQLALRLSLLVFSVLPVWLLFGVWTAAQMPAPQKRVLTVGSLVYLVMLFLGLWLRSTDASWLPAAGPVKQVVDLRLNGVAIGLVFFWITMLERSAQKKAYRREVDALRQQAMQARSQQAELDERSALIDMLTHELKNPLATVRFALASLKQQAQDHKDWLMRLQNIDLSTRRMDELIERVAHFNKMERATATSSPRRIDAGSLIQELLGEVSRPEQWQLRVASATSFCCDRQLLTMILDNLMTNASKYALRDQPICIEVSHSSGHSSGRSEATPEHAAPFTRFEISNHVDPANVPQASRIFERYYRHPQAQSQPGMGLGLSVVKTAAHKIGAHMAYRHTNDQVFFTLTVPA